jgi:hypothetical protein
MKRYLIERRIPDIGHSDAALLCNGARRSNAVLQDLGPDIQWQHSYITADKIMCVYLARDIDLIHQHAERSGFPAHRVTEVCSLLDPTSANTTH